MKAIIFHFTGAIEQGYAEKEKRKGLKALVGSKYELTISGLSIIKDAFRLRFDTYNRKIMERRNIIRKTEHIQFKYSY